VRIDDANYPKLAGYVSSILARPGFAPWIEREAGFLSKQAA